MNMDSLPYEPSTKKTRFRTNFEQCFICQDPTNPEKLIEKPDEDSHGKVLFHIRERAKYGDKKYPEISRRSGTIEEAEMKSQGASWHRSCYSSTVHSRDLDRAKKRFEKKVGVNNETDSDNVMFRRSQSKPLQKDDCFFL